ncbi:hypothetical protein GCM10027577_35630 [Spirosoma fluminis]
MGRTQKKPSAVQLDPKLFSEIKAAIVSVGPTKLIQDYNLKKTSLFKYKRGQGVEPAIERQILVALKKAGSKNHSALAKEVASLHAD